MPNMRRRRGRPWRTTDWEYFSYWCLRERRLVALQRGHFKGDPEEKALQLRQYVRVRS